VLDLRLWVERDRWSLLVPSAPAASVKATVPVGPPAHSTLRHACLELELLCGGYSKHSVLVFGSRLHALDPSFPLVRQVCLDSSGELPGPSQVVEVRDECREVQRLDLVRAVVELVEGCVEVGERVQDKRARSWHVDLEAERRHVALIL
jgi:hypothetical protein